MLKLVFAAGVVQVGVKEAEHWLSSAKLKSEGNARPTRGSA
jgi:hypothetical protein